MKKVQLILSKAAYGKCIVTKLKQQQNM